jgi:hypothetical protein
MLAKKPRLMVGLISVNGPIALPGVPAEFTGILDLEELRSLEVRR